MDPLTPEEIKEEKRKKMQEWRSKRSPEKKQTDSAKDAETKRNSRAKFSPDQHAVIIANDADKHRKSRAEHSSDQRAVVHAKNVEEKRTASTQRTPEKRAQDLVKDKEIKRQKRDKEMSEQHSHQANFTLTSLEDSTTFYDFEQNPETSVLLYLLNSGNEKFRQLDSINMATDTMLPQEDFESLQKEIQDELLTPEEH